MASSVWSLNKNGGSYSALSALGIVGATVVKASLDVGSLTFVIPVSDIAAAAPFAFGDSVILRRNTTIWWVGRVRQVRANFSGAQSSWSVACFDSWWEMERTVYRQPLAVSKDNFSGLVGFLSTRVTLGLDAWGVPIPQQNQIANAVAYGAAYNPGIMSLAAAPAMAAFPAEETREITVAEAIRRSASLAAVATGYIDYSSGVAALGFAQRSGLGLVTLDLAAANLISEVSGLRRRDDLVPPGVIFDFFTTVTDPAGKQLTKVTRDSAGAPSGAGTVMASFNLGPCDAVPIGSAAAYYAALNTGQWEGTIMLMQLECAGSVSPGNRLRLANGQAAWATMDAVVQRTTEDLDHGLTTIEVGPSVVLGQDDFVDRLMRLRNRPAPTAFCQVQHNSTQGVPNGIDDNGNPTTPDGGSGVTNPATGNKPGIGAPAANPSAGVPASTAATATTMGIPAADFRGFKGVDITLCDSTRLTVIVKA